jgi:hypothetical protein
MNYEQSVFYLVQGVLEIMCEMFFGKRNDNFEFY